MKRSKITFFLAIVLGITLHSCLDMEPQDQLGGKNMWTSVNDYKQFANIVKGCIDMKVNTN